MTKHKAERNLIRSSVSGAFVVCAAVLLAGCASIAQKVAGIEPLERVVGPHDPVPPGGGRYQVGKPYSIAGRTYVPREDPHYDAVGVASWYGGEYHHGTRTANGEVYDRTTLSAAHPTLPLPSYARVTNVKNGRSIVVRVNDRGPYAPGRIIDISEKTAEMLEMKRFGLGQVRIQYIGRAGLGGSDQRVLASTLRIPGASPMHDDRVMVASADLPVGPRRNMPTIGPALQPSAQPILVADARPAPAPTSADSSLFARPKAATLPVATRAYAPVDAASYDLAGVDAAALRAAIAQSRPASSSAEVVAAELPTANGAPMMLLPVPDATALATAAQPQPLTTSSLPQPQSRFTTSALPQSQSRALTTSALPLPRPSHSSSYAAEERIEAAHAIFAGLGEGSRLSSLAD